MKIHVLPSIMLLTKIDACKPPETIGLSEWTYSSSGVWYHLSDEAVNWYEASEKCAAIDEKVSLACITSKEENVVVESIIQEIKRSWIGGIYVDNEWKWVLGAYQGPYAGVSNYQKMEGAFLNFRRSDFNARSTNKCAQIKGFKKEHFGFWSSKRCDFESRYICEFRCGKDEAPKIGMGRKLKIGGKKLNVFNKKVNKIGKKDQLFKNDFDEIWVARE